MAAPASPMAPRANVTKRGFVGYGSHCGTADCEREHTAISFTYHNRATDVKKQGFSDENTTSQAPICPAIPHQFLNFTAKCDKVKICKR